MVLNNLTLVEGYKSLKYIVTHCPISSLTSLKAISLSQIRMSPPVSLIRSVASRKSNILLNFAPTRSLKIMTTALAGHRIERDTFGKKWKKLNYILESHNLNHYFCILCRWTRSTKRQVLWSPNIKIRYEFSNRWQNIRAHAIAGHQGIWSVEKICSTSKSRIRIRYVLTYIMCVYYF